MNLTNRECEALVDSPASSFHLAAPDQLSSIYTFDAKSHVSLTSQISWYIQNNEHLTRMPDIILTTKDGGITEIIVKSEGKYRTWGDIMRQIRGNIILPMEFRSQLLHTSITGKEYWAVVGYRYKEISDTKFIKDPYHCATKNDKSSIHRYFNSWHKNEKSIGFEEHNI